MIREFNLTWPTSNIYAIIKSKNPLSKSNLFLFNKHTKKGIKINHENSKNITNCYFSMQKIELDAATLDNIEFIHKGFYYY